MRCLLQARFNNVEMLAAEKIRRETVQQVSNIYEYYLAYKMVFEEREFRERAKEAVKEEADRERRGTLVLLSL
jgi:hypothetical protein